MRPNVAAISDLRQSENSIRPSQDSQTNADKEDNNIDNEAMASVRHANNRHNSSVQSSSYNRDLS